MANQVNVKITGDVTGLVEGAKKGQQAVQQLGNQSKKSASQIKTIGAAANNEKKIINQLAYQYHNLSGAEKEAFGPRIQQQINSHISKLKEYKSIQDNINTQIKGSTSNISQMGNAFSTAGAQLGLPIANLSALLNPMTAAIAGVAALGAAFVKTAKESEQFNSAMNDFKNRIQLNNQEIEMFKKEAIELGNKFGISGTEIVKQFNNISQQLPGIQKDKKGLIDLTEAVNKLAIGMGADLSTATNAAVTVMSKWNLSASEAAKVTNVIAEASRNSGASLEYQTTVFEKVGVAASAVGISYKEIAAATSLLSSTFADAGQVGQGLSLLITKMAKQKDEFNPAVVGMQNALKNLADAQLSYNDIVGMVGPKGAQVVQALIQQQAAFDKLTVSMNNTQAAEDMFGVKSEELGQVINRIKTLWENFLLKVGETQVFKTIMGIISDICKWIEQLSKEIQEMVQKGDLSGFQKEWEMLRDIIKQILPILGALIKITLQYYSTIYEGISKVWNVIKTFYDNLFISTDELGRKITGTWNSIYDKLMQTTAMRKCALAFQNMANTIISSINDIIRGWNALMDGIGETSLKIKELGLVNVGKIFSDAPGRQTSYGKGNNDDKKNRFAWSNRTTNPINTTGGGGSGSGSGRGGSRGGGSSTSTPMADENSIEWYNQKIKEQEELLKSKAQTEEKEREIIAEILRLEKERDEIAKRQANQRKWQEEVAKIASGEGKNTSTELFMTQLPDLSKIKPEPIKIEIEPDLEGSKWRKGIKNATDALGELGSMFSSLASATGSEELNVMGIIAQSIANIALGASKAIAEAASLGPWGWIAFGAAAMAQMASMISQIHSATGFADGGIVQGSTTMGDKIVTRLNAGEMVLNQRQQSNLFNALDRGISLENGGNVTTSIVKIKGSDLYLALQNHSKITGKKL